MTLAVLFHVAAGALALAAGGAALFSVKGSAGHRRAGLAFALTMLAMALSGGIVSAAVLTGTAQRLNILVAAVTLYLVVTGWAAIRARSGEVAALDRGLCAFGFATAVAGVGLIAFAAANRQPASAGIYTVFTVIALRGATLDLKLIRAGGATTKQRLPRHLWRMCAALAIAAFAFFLGQQDEFPQAIRGAHLALPPLAVLAAMIWWLVKLRPRGKAEA